jgi:hypothetical protein
MSFIARHPFLKFDAAAYSTGTTQSAMRRRRLREQ